VLNLGKYEQAIQLFEQSLQMKIRVGDRRGEGFNHFGIAMAHLALGHDDRAESELHSSLMLRQQIHDERGIGHCLHGLGQLALKREQYGPAKDYRQQAYELHSRLGLKGETIEDLSYLSQVHLGAGKLDIAVTASNQALALFAQQVNVPGEEHQILFNHFRTLAAQQDATARDLLKQTYDLMHSQANRISDPADRQVYLEQLKLNQEIMAEINSGRWEIQ
jgi:tetratricopeptide (TPR) repeat protein